MTNLFSRIEVTDKDLKRFYNNKLEYYLYQVGPNNHRVCYREDVKHNPNFNKIFSLEPEEVSQYMKSVLQSQCSIHHLADAVTKLTKEEQVNKILKDT